VAGNPPTPCGVGSSQCANLQVYRDLLHLPCPWPGEHSTESLEAKATATQGLDCIPRHFETPSPVGQAR
jgi:hypothetical protein